MKITAAVLAPVAVVLTVGGFVPGPVHAEEPAPVVASASSGDEVAALQARLRDLRALEAGDVCHDPAAVEALLSPASLAPASLDTVQPPPEEPAKPEGPKALARQELVGLLQRAVVMVIAGRDTGTGFFIDGRTIVTNRHVIAHAQGDEVVVVGPGIGGPRTARIVASAGGRVAADRDYAVLHVNGTPATASLAFSPQVTELESVVAAGFPGLLLDNDQNFKALIDGDMSALPDLAYSQGAVMALQNRNSPVPTIAHSAPISGGNSGGPLVDRCGRVLGINTFINVSVDQASSAGFAIASDDLLRYLRELGLDPQVRDGTCE